MYHLFVNDLNAIAFIYWTFRHFQNPCQNLTFKIHSLQNPAKVIIVISKKWTQTQLKWFLLSRLLPQMSRPVIISCVAGDIFWRWDHQRKAPFPHPQVGRWWGRWQKTLGRSLSSPSSLSSKSALESMSKLTNNIEET